MIDIDEEEKLMNIIGGDPDMHPRVIKRASIKNYHDYLKKYKNWAQV